MKFAENVATIEGNAVFEETVKMSVENESISHIIKSLTDMYSNPMLALSREYVSNAYDAVIARMGVESSFGTVLDTPIEVTLPSSLNPNFVVRDYGTGMNREVLSKVFPRYGASTKRNNNNEIGGFGLGAKSALAVVANFTVVSVKDGKKNVGIVQKGEDGVGEISFLPETETDEASGTTITITLPKAHELNQIFRDSTLLLGFPHGSILLNGQMHENSVFNTDVFTKLSEDGYVLNSMLDFDNHHHSHLGHGYGRGWGYQQVVVVGPISYRVSESDLRDEDSSENILGQSSHYSVLNLPIGSVDFTPARENLIFSERTRKTIIEAVKRLNAEVQKFAQKSITEAPTKKEALRRASKLRYDGFTLDFTYNGEKIPTMTLPSLHVEGKETWESGSYSRQTPNEVNLLDCRASSTSSAVVVTGVENAEKAKFLNRLRKPFADRYNPSKVNAHNLEIIYTQAEKSELTSWADSLVMEIMTVDEWEAKGAAYRKEINEERKAKRAANAQAGTINYGSLPVSLITSSYNSVHDRPKVASYSAAEIAKYDTVVYFRADNSAPETFSHKFAKTMSENNEVLSVKAMNNGIKAVMAHYRKDDKKAAIVRVPAGTKVETFLKAIPHAISMDEALKVVADDIVANKDETIALLIAERPMPFQWLDIMTDVWTDKIENEEVRAFIAKAHEGFKKSEDRLTRGALSARANFVFAVGLESLFDGFRAEVKASNKYKLPLLTHTNSYNLEGKDAVQYINLMYPKAA